MQDRLAALLRFRWVFVGLGLALILGGAAATVYEARRSESYPIIRYPTAIAVSDANEIFLYSEWSRIRVFDSSGKQLRSWRVDTSEGMAVLHFEEPEVLEVASARNDRLYRFTTAGELLSSVRDPEALERIGIDGRRAARGPDGETYRIENMSVTRSKGGAVEVVVRGVPGILRPLYRFALPPIVLAVHGMVVLALGAALVAQRSGFDRGVAAQRGVAADHEQLS